MPFEGGPRFPSEEPRGSAESREESGFESSQESWLSRFIAPEDIENARHASITDRWSTERIILERLLGLLVEASHEWDPNTRARLKNVVGVFRAAAFPNMTSADQRFLENWAHANNTVAATITYDITPEVQEDMTWIWATHRLQIPPRRIASPIFMQALPLRHQLPPRPNPHP